MKEFLKSIRGIILTIVIFLAILLMSILNFGVAVFIFIYWRRKIKLSIDPMVQLKKRNTAL